MIIKKIKSLIPKLRVKKSPQAPEPDAKSGVVTALKSKGEWASGGILCGLVQVDGGRLQLGLARLKGGRVTVLRTHDDEIPELGDIPVEKIVAGLRELGLRKGKVYVVASMPGIAAIPVTLPPVKRAALRKIINGRVASDLRLPASEVQWDAPAALWQGSKMQRQGMVVAAAKKIVRDWERLDTLGYTLELLTTPELSLAAVAEQLAPGRNGVYIMLCASHAWLVALSTAGPCFARRLEIASDAADYFHALENEVHHSSLYIRQHMKVAAEHLGLIGVHEAPPENIRENFTHWNVALLAGDQIAAGATDSLYFAAAAAALGGSKRAPANLLAPKAGTRRAIGMAIAAVWLGVVMLAALSTTQYLELDTKQSQLAREKSELEQRLISLREEAKPTATMLEAAAHKMLAGLEELQYPEWEALLREINLVHSPEIVFESLAISSLNQRAGRRNKDKAVDGTWNLILTGRLAPGPYTDQQKAFNRWHRNMLQSPYLTQVALERIDMQGHAAPMNRITGARNELRFTLSAQVLSNKGVHDVIDTL